LASVLQDLEAIPPEQWFSSADAQEKSSRISELADHILNLGCRHFAFAIVIEIAMDATLIAAPCDIEVRAQRDALLSRLLRHFV
jgi:hypothetical protein